MANVNALVESKVAKALEANHSDLKKKLAAQ